MGEPERALRNYERVQFNSDSAPVPSHGFRHMRGRRPGQFAVHRCVVCLDRLGF